MYSRLYSGSVFGISAFPVEIETHLENAVPVFLMVGLPDSAVKESRERVSAAIKNSDLPFPNKKITVNLAPADIRKEGCAFDLPIALGIISAMGLLEEQALQESMFVGELALDGSLRSVHGTLSIALMAKELGKKQMLVPYDNAEEAGMVEDIHIIPVNSLAQSLRYLKNEEKIDPHKSDIASLFSHKSSSDIDISDIKGQENVKRALEIAAAGGHNIIKIGMILPYAYICYKINCIIFLDLL